MDYKIKKILFESFDRDLKPGEQNKLDKALAESAELQKEKADLERMRNKISTQSGQTFNVLFADRVMHGIRRVKIQKENLEFFESIAHLFRPIAIAAAVLIIAMASLNLFESDRVSLESAIAVPEVTVNDAYNPLVDYQLE
jgi:hypothetical protein